MTASVQIQKYISFIQDDLGIEKPGPSVQDFVKKLEQHIDETGSPTAENLLECLEPWTEKSKCSIFELLECRLHQLQNPINSRRILQSMAIYSRVSSD